MTHFAPPRKFENEGERREKEKGGADGVGRKDRKVERNKEKTF